MACFEGLDFDEHFPHMYISDHDRIFLSQGFVKTTLKYFLGSGSTHPMEFFV